MTLTAKIYLIWCRKAISHIQFREIALRYLQVNFSTTYYFREQGFSCLIKIVMILHGNRLSVNDDKCMRNQRNSIRSIISKLIKENQTKKSY